MPDYFQEKHKHKRMRFIIKKKTAKQIQETFGSITKSFLFQKHEDKNKG